MTFTLFNYRVIIEPIHDYKSLIYRKAEANAQEALEFAKLDLLHKKALKEKVKEHNRTEAEITGINNAIDQLEKSIANWETQLEVIHNTL